MRKQILLMTLLFASGITYSQVGINTQNPKGAFHVDAKGDNNASGTPLTEQQKNDFIVTEEGNVGIGTITPSQKLQINTGIASSSGLRISNINTSTPSTASRGLGVNSSGTVITHSFSAITGDIKFSAASSDHDGWYLMNGRAVSSLPETARTTAASFGYTSTLPNPSDRVLKSRASNEALGNMGGGPSSLTISQANLPNYTIYGSYSGSTSESGWHRHGPPDGANGYLLTGTLQNNAGTGTWIPNAFPPASWNGSGTLNYLNEAGSHSHSIYGSGAVSLGGQNVPIDNQQAYISFNAFIYLGQ